MNKTTAIGISVLTITMLFSMVSAQGTLQSGARDAVKNITRMAKLEVRKLEF